MIQGLNPYPEMKDSGVEWLGEVPAHWKVRRLGQMGSFSKGSGGTKADEVKVGVPCVRYGDLYNQHRYFIEKTRSFVSEDAAKTYTPIRYGDVLFAGSGETIEEIGKSAVNLLTDPACCGGDVIIFRPSAPVHSRFLGLAVDSPAAAYQKSCMGRGITIMHVYGSELKNLRIAMPPLPEQIAIDRYLDHVDRRVRRMVWAKRKLIALLTEQKQAIIHRAVTRGLDPDVPMKDSGVEWLGEVPAHWEVHRTKNLFREVDQRSATGEETHLSMSQRLGLVPSDMVQSTLTSESYSGGKLCETDDLVLNRLKAHLGVFALAKQGGVISPDYSVFRQRHPVSMKYYELTLRSPACRRELYIRAKGIVEGFWRLYSDDFFDIRVPMPPVQEQHRIVAVVGQETAKIDTAIVRAKREVELVHEYRTRLIADVVTGKLDVRGAAARLPDEIEVEVDADEACADDTDAAPEEVEA